MAKRVPDFLSMLWIVAVALLASAVFAGACARKETVARKSAATYDEAAAKGLPIGSGHGGHGHGAVASRSSEEPPDTGANPMSGMNHAEHSTSVGVHDDSTGAEPSKTAGHEPAEPKMTASAGHDHGAETERAEESAPDLSQAPDATAERAEVEELDPEATLRQDGLDAPAPSSVSEAQRAGGHAHADHERGKSAPAEPLPAAPPGHDHHSAPPAPEGNR